MVPLSARPGLLLLAIAVLSCQSAMCPGAEASSATPSPAPARAAAEQACGGLKHGGKDAASVACVEGFMCIRQDMWWWWCKPKQLGGPPTGSSQHSPILRPSSPALPKPGTAAIQPYATRTTQHGGIVFRRFRAMIKGRVLVRDAASISWDALRYQYGPQIHTAGSCENICRRTNGCNAWRLCPGFGTSNGTLHPGCGTGCLAYAKAHRIWKRSDKDHKWQSCGLTGCSETMVNITWPAEFIGPYNGFGTGSCAWTCKDGKVCKPKAEEFFPPSCINPVCSNPAARVLKDSWSFGTCTLLQVDNPAQPTFVTGPESALWESGTVVLPAPCRGLSGQSCQVCFENKNSSAAAVNTCLGCIRAKNVTGAQQITFEDHMGIWCKAAGGKWEYYSSNSGLRYSELGCAYGVDKLTAMGLTKPGAQCEGRKQLPVRYR